MITFFAFMQLHIYIYKYNTVSSEKEQVTYIGMTSTKFREIYNNHDKSFNHN